MHTCFLTCDMFRHALRFSNQLENYHLRTFIIIEYFFINQCKEYHILFSCFVWPGEGKINTSVGFDKDF